MSLTSTQLQTLATQFKTPLYVYDAAELRRNCADFKAAFVMLQPHFHYAVKANGNLSLLRLIAAEGFGFDIVSGGELARLQAIGLPLHDVGFAGVGKTEPEVEAAIRAGIGFFNVESAGELAAIAVISQRLKRESQVLLRLNPNVEAQTHHYITTGKAANKFGLDFETASALVQQYGPHNYLNIVGVHLHIGSQIRQIEPYLAATRKALNFIAHHQAAGHRFSWFNLGGGFGIAAEEIAGLDLNALATGLQPLLANTGLSLILEPGRRLVASAGTLLTRVQYVKQNGGKHFAIVDSGMHHLIRPALYGGQHRIVRLGGTGEPEQHYDVVGPICESSDFLGKDVSLPVLQPGDLLAVNTVGAYGMVMASTYNAQPRPAEVLVDGEQTRLIRGRETVDDLFALELDGLG